MQTITIEQIRQNPDLWFSQYGSEPMLLKTEQNQMFFLMPVNFENWQEIVAQHLALISKSKKQVSDSVINENLLSAKQETFEDFDKQWCGFMKGAEIPENWRDDYIYDKMKKQQ